MSEWFTGNCVATGHSCLTPPPPPNHLLQFSLLCFGYELQSLMFYFLAYLQHIITMFLFCRLKLPCDNNSCVATYGFKNVLPLVNDTEEFQVNISSSGTIHLHKNPTLNFQKSFPDNCVHLFTLWIFPTD